MTTLSRFSDRKRVGPRACEATTSATTVFPSADHFLCVFPATTKKTSLETSWPARVPCCQSSRRNSKSSSSTTGHGIELPRSWQVGQHECNRGYGAAVTTALQAATGEWVCMTDGDGQFNLLDLPQLLVDAQQADVVVGYRHRRADNGIRKLNAHSWKWLIRCLMGLKVRDLDCAFKLFPRWVVDSLQFRAEGACISAEILTQCSRGGLAICEVPVNHFPRSAGKPTGANLGVVLKAFRELPIVWQYRNMPPWALERRTEKAFAPAHSSNGSAACETADVAESGDSVLAVG
jgi:hypothetical protein